MKDKYKNLTIHVTFDDNKSKVLANVREARFHDGMLECEGDPEFTFFIGLNKVKTLHFAPSEFRGLYEDGDQITGFASPKNH